MDGAWKYGWMEFQEELRKAKDVKRKRDGEFNVEVREERRKRRKEETKQTSKNNFVNPPS